jgi:hypothetical protein
MTLNTMKLNIMVLTKITQNKMTLIILIKSTMTLRMKAFIILEKCVILFHKFFAEY